MDSSQFINDMMKQACESNRYDLIDYMLSNGFQVKEEYFTIASASGSLEVLKCLLSRYNSPKLIESSLNIAAESGKLNIVKYLVNSYKGISTFYAMLISCENQHYDITRYLEENGSVSKDSMNQICSMALTCGYKEVARLVVDDEEVLNKIKEERNIPDEEWKKESSNNEFKDAVIDLINQLPSRRKL